MTAIWRDDGTGWKLLAPTGFPDEAALHSLVEQAPQVLPLAGAPRLVVVGREVVLGNGFADLVAVESTGRLVVIEIKLAQNAEARRAVVAQILAYAAYLKGLDVTQLETVVLAKHLRQRGYQSLTDALRNNDQEGAFDATEFSNGLAESLSTGAFRLVLVLDRAPDELIRLVGYLESITDTLVIDLVTIASYTIDRSQILIPQRVEPERQPGESISAPSAPKPQGYLVDGAADFETAIDEATQSEQPLLRRLCGWAVALEQEGLVSLSTYHGVANRLTLLPRLQADNAGLVTIWNEQGRGYIQFWRSVFLRRAPHALPYIEELIAPTPVGQGNTLRDIPGELLDVLTTAYREAAGQS